jgi:arylformamidase
MKFYDISINLSPESMRWVTSPEFEFVERYRMSRGDEKNSSSIKMSVHSGTHVDAPFHFVADGATIESLPLEIFIGPALVHAIDADRYITKEQVEAIDLNGESRVLFKTKNSQLLHQPTYDPNFVAFSVEAAEALAKQGVKLVGLDYLSIAHAEEQVAVHRPFLDRGVILLEGVDLSDVRPGRYELICFPIRLRGLDAAPCRAVLRELTK